MKAKLKKKGDEDGKLSAWGIAPYARYKCFEADKLSVWTQASIGYAAVTQDEMKATGIAVQFAPVLKYSLSHHMKLISRVNFLSIGFASTSIKYDGNDIGSQTSFGIGVNKFHDSTSSENAALNGLFTIGFEYEF